MSRKHVSMSTSFEAGKRDGQWTDEQIRSCGFKSAQECLEHQEQVYREEVANLSQLAKKNPAYAAQHAEYLEGLISGTRQSLRR